MKKLSVIVTRDGYNNLLQTWKLITLAASHSTQVGVLVHDEAASNMSLQKGKGLTFSEGYRGQETYMHDLLREQRKGDLQGLLGSAKEAGDVKFSVSCDFVGYFSIPVEELIPEQDKVQQTPAFWKEEISETGQVLTF